jgi:hypothetical protein
MSWYQVAEEVNRLIAAKHYARAIAVLRAQLRHDATNLWFRQRLADVLEMNGQRQEALHVLDSVVETLLEGGFQAKAVAVVKKMQRLAPDDPANEELLASIVGRRNQEGVGRAQHGAASGLGNGAPGNDRLSQLAAAIRLPAATRYAQPAMAMPADRPVPPPRAPAPAAEDLVVEVVDVDASDHQPPPQSRTDQVDSGNGAGSNKGAEAPAGSRLFTQLAPPALLAVLRGFTLKSYQAGDILITEGEPSHSALVLVSGAARMWVRDANGHSHLSGTIGEGELFGEVSTVGGRLRRATVTATTPCEALELDCVTLQGIAREHPEVLAIIRTHCDCHALAAKREVEAHA